MLRVHSNTKLEGFTEFEEHILFDEDDPDFQDSSIFFRSERRITFRESSILTSAVSSTTMSVASVHPAELHSSHSSLTTLSHSLEDIHSDSWSPHQLHSEHVLTIEELRLHMTSCFTCGVSWNDSHVSLDCRECGGYALERPCPVCDGACGAVWKRDLSLSHASSKARWQGECYQQQKATKDNTSLNNTTTTPSSSSTPASITQDLSSRLEKLSANS